MVGSTLSIVAHAQSTVCTMTGLTGAAQQENLLYCANGTNIAPSTYPEAIALAQMKNIVVGYPTMVTSTVDWPGVPVTDVEFSRGYHAEHHCGCNGTDAIVRYYSPEDIQVWP